MLLKRSMAAKKLGEDMLKQIESYNKEVREAVKLHKVISRKMKETIRTAQSLQEEPLPPVAKVKIKEYQQKYANIESLGVMLGELKSFKQSNQVIN